MRTWRIARRTKRRWGGGRFRRDWKSSNGRDGGEATQEKWSLRELGDRIKKRWFGEDTQTWGDERSGGGFYKTTPASRLKLLKNGSSLFTEWKMLFLDVRIPRVCEGQTTLSNKTLNRRNLSACFCSTFQWYPTEMTAQTSTAASTVSRQPVL